MHNVLQQKVKFLKFQLGISKIDAFVCCYCDNTGDWGFTHAFIFGHYFQKEKNTATHPTGIIPKVMFFDEVS